MPIFEAHNISMRLPDGRWLFEEINIQLERGDVLALRGPSGVGKTTLLKCLAELIPYNEGYSVLHGKKPAEYGIPEWRSRVMYVPQRPATHPGCPMDLFKAVKKFSSQKHKAKLGNPITIGMNWELSESHFYEKWSNLSGGEMQRCSLAIAIALAPDILLLDEPTSALDPQAVSLVEKTLKGKTCIWITHDPQQEQRVATRTLKMTRQRAPTPLDSDEESQGIQEQDDRPISITMDV
ncbi:P-loop containing nucleoside triphosphate hydrolase protein [Radiomyces spectabilis]|uniref:P-loop containing nucleoside triphosphate hydrolase protein n=1 Tax=Radiomyces spectabilis TaxID=64574 RepID=UPI00221F67A9|nr:P-loop containing nucleoside triphosphate hydrolase protein [Radiomyces spectabilis]KAI8373190.1 P-loop containing nucleoside triphosphate hydrolase protein [Radiomyces spectabilis]